MDETSTTEITADIVAAYVASNSIAAVALPNLIRDIHAALQRIANGESATQQLVEKLVPAVSVRKSVTPDFIICLEDGKRYKSLKRHLSAAYSMTPADYRAKWGLPDDYPMVAPNYAAQRSTLARTIGLGQTLRKPKRRPKQ